MCATELMACNECEEQQNKTKLHGVTFYPPPPNPHLHQTDMKLKKKNNLTKPLTYIQVIFKTLARIFVSVAMTIDEKSYCTVHHSRETTVTFPVPAATWLNSQNCLSARTEVEVRRVVKTRAIVLSFAVCVSFFMGATVYR